MLDHASEIADGSKLGIDATTKLPGEGFKTGIDRREDEGDAVSTKK